MGKSTKEKLLAQCIRIYIELFSHFVTSLKKEKRYKNARRFAEIKLRNLEDIFEADDLLRNTFVHSARHPNATAPCGFSGLLGMTLALRGMDYDIKGMHFQNGTFTGHFAEFCHSEHDFGQKLGELMLWDARDVASRVFHEVD